MPNKENFIITGNQTAANNQYTGGSGFTPLPGQVIQYGRVISINLKDRSITYETIQNNLGISALDKPNKITGIAYNFNPNFTRLPKVGELVPLIPGPNNRVGNSVNQYDQILYYIIGSISSQITVDDNKVPQDNPPLPADSVNNYRINEMGFVKPQPGQVVPSTTPTPVPPSSAPSETPTPTPTPTPTINPTQEPTNVKGNFIRVYTNTAGQQFDLFYRTNGPIKTVYAYKRNTDNLVVTGQPNAAASIALLVETMELLLKDNTY